MGEAGDEAGARLRRPNSQTGKRILIADDHNVVRLGLKSIIAQQNGWIVCGEACNGLEAISKTVELQPDLIILDISMPTMTGLQAAIKIREIAPSTKILFLSLHDRSLMPNVLASSGAHAYLSKTASTDEFIQTVSKLMNDGHPAPAEFGSLETPAEVGPRSIKSSSDDQLQQ